MSSWRSFNLRFEKLESRLRSWCARHPIVYALVGGVGIVLFWRGVWVTADEFMPYVLLADPTGGALSSPRLFLDGPITLFVSIIILLVTGLFVPSFIGNETILSGLRGEKTVAEKTKEEVVAEETEMQRVAQEEKKERQMVTEIRDELRGMEKELVAIKEEEKARAKAQ